MLSYYIQMHIKHAILFKVLSNTLHINGSQPPLTHPLSIDQVFGHPSWHLPAGTTTERHFPDERHICISPEGRNISSAAPASKTDTEKGGVYFTRSCSCDCLNTPRQRWISPKIKRIPFNKWVIHICPHTVCPCNRNLIEQQKMLLLCFTIASKCSKTALNSLFKSMPIAQNG